METTPVFVKQILYNIELVNVAFTTFLQTFDFTNQLSIVKADTLIFSGEFDWIFDVEQAKILQAGIKNSILIQLENCGHFPWQRPKRHFFI